MKHTLSFVLVLTFIEFTSSSTFMVSVKTDSKSRWHNIFHFKNCLAGMQYIEYDGERFYLTDDPAEKETAFLRKDCIVKINLSKANLEFHRPGSA